MLFILQCLKTLGKQCLCCLSMSFRYCLMSCCQTLCTVRCGTVVVVLSVVVPSVESVEALSTVIVQICVRYFKFFQFDATLISLSFTHPSNVLSLYLSDFAVGNDSLSSGLGFVLVECFIYTDHICIVAFDDTVIILAILQLCFFRYFISREQVSSSSFSDPVPRINVSEGSDKKTSEEESLSELRRCARA